MESVAPNKNFKYAKITKALAFVVVLYSISAFIVYLRLGSVRDQVTLQITEQQTLLIALSETTARNGADSVTESIVKDCDVKERADFDDLLGGLDKGLSRAELLKLENLLGSCGSFYAERKALMVSRLDRELEVYVAHVEQLKTLTTIDSVSSYDVDGWLRLVEQEKEQSELFTSLVTQQNLIIETLISGTRTDSEEMKAILEAARETQEALLLTNRQTAQTRATLIPL